MVNADLYYKDQDTVVPVFTARADYMREFVSEVISELDAEARALKYQLKDIERMLANSKNMNDDQRAYNLATAHSLSKQRASLYDFMYEWEMFNDAHVDNPRLGILARSLTYVTMPNERMEGYSDAVMRGALEALQYVGDVECYRS